LDLVKASRQGLAGQPSVIERGLVGVGQAHAGTIRRGPQGPVLPLVSEDPGVLGRTCVREVKWSRPPYGTPVSSVVGSERRASDHLQIVVVINPTVTSMAARQSGFQHAGRSGEKAKEKKVQTKKI